MLNSNGWVLLKAIFLFGVLCSYKDISHCIFPLFPIGMWQWVDGSNLTPSSSHWDQGEPNNLGNEDCGEMRGGVLVWNDVPCGLYFHYVCEIDKG